MVLRAYYAADKPDRSFLLFPPKALCPWSTMLPEHLAIRDMCVLDGPTATLAGSAAIPGR
jgi:hypothetical protein